MDDIFDEKMRNTLFINLIKNQRKNIKKLGNYGKLTFDDIKRIDKYLRDNIFNSCDCCIYRGELKKNYATISYKGKKVSVHRLLYHNYINDLIGSDYIVFKCQHRGICCNLKHFTMSKKRKLVVEDGNDNKLKKNKTDN